MTSVDYLQDILEALFFTHKYGIAIPQDQWIKIVFEDEKDKILRSFVDFDPVYKQTIEKELQYDELELDDFIGDWINCIKISGFPGTSACCSEVFILQPKTRNTAGVKELDEFGKELVAQGLISSSKVGLFVKGCKCT